MLIAGRSTSAAQADEHAVRDADVRTVVGVLLSKFVRSYDHDQPLVSAAPAGPLWNIKCVQVLFEMANGEISPVDMFAACYAYGAQEGSTCGYSACLIDVQWVSDALYFLHQPKRTVGHFPSEWTEEEKVNVCLVRPWKVFIVVASAVLRHCSEHKTLQDPNMSAADKALTSKAEMMCGEFMQAEMLKRAGAIPGGVSAAGTAQAAMAGSSLPGLVQAGVCVGGVTHPGASHPGSTTGPPDQTAENDVSQDDQQRQDEWGRMLDATEARSFLALSKAQRSTFEAAARRTFDDNSIQKYTIELDSVRQESLAQTGKFLASMKTSQHFEGLNLSAADQVVQMTVPVTKHNEEVTNFTNWHQHETSSLQTVASRRQGVLDATNEELHAGRAAAPLALGNANAAAQLAPGPPARNTHTHGLHHASQPTGLPRLPAPPFGGLAGVTGPTRLQPPPHSGSAGPSLLRQQLSLRASATAGVLPGQRALNPPASTVAGRMGHSAPATTAWQRAQSAPVLTVTGQSGQSTSATQVAGRSSDASGCSPMSISPAQSAAAAPLPLLLNHPSYPMLASALASAQTLHSSFTIPPALLTAARPLAASGSATTTVPPARGWQGGAGSGASTQRVTGLTLAAGTPAAPPTFPGPSTPLGAPTSSIQFLAWTPAGTPGTSFIPSVAHLPAAGVQASIGLLPPTTLPGPATPATPSDVNMSPGSSSTGL